MTRSIAVAGKGGTGKSTIAALIILGLCERKMGPVLAVDADPDANLGFLLGINVKRTIGDLREEVLKELAGLPPGMSKAQYFEAGLHEIIEESEGFDLITMGRGEGSGCYCYLNSLIRKFSEDLFPSYRWVVIDNEAGLEHISRRTTSNIDVLLIIVNDNPISLKTAKNIDILTMNLKNEIRYKYVVTNMVPPEKLYNVRKSIEEIGIIQFCDIPRDDGIEKAIYSGKPLRGIGNSVIKKCIDEIINKLNGSLK